MITYCGAHHAFTVFGEKRYQEAADGKSWRVYRQLLEEKLK
jgi:hypothetical protein